MQDSFNVVLIEEGEVRVAVIQADAGGYRPNHEEVFADRS